MNYRHVTFKENQERAHEILDFYGITSESDMPVDPEPILWKMGISVVPFRGLRFRYGPLGFVTKINSDLQVWVDEHHYINQPESSLFTIGEELGHIILHLEDFDIIKSIDDWNRIALRNLQFYDKLENQARTFSANIILPSFIFDDYVLDWISKHPGHREELMSTSFDDLAYKTAFLIKDDLGISPSILEIILTERWPNPVVYQIAGKFPDLIIEQE
ncbi:MAG: hypothetical protein K940chlam2_01656 [Chlamydiae bacterium]|nr:hypothetical protein [Chlamydiota bacterium]